MQLIFHHLTQTKFFQELQVISVHHRLLTKIVNLPVLNLKRAKASVMLKGTAMLQPIRQQLRDTAMVHLNSNRKGIAIFQLNSNRKGIAIFQLNSNL